MRRTQLGISMIELMVSMLIGLFLAAGIIQLFIGTKNTYRQVDASARIQENARFAFDFLGNSIRMAGYVDRPDLYLQNLVPGAAAFPADNIADPSLGGVTLQSLGLATQYFVANQVISGVNNADIIGASGKAKAKANTDVLLIRYMGNEDGLTTDCAGNEVKPFTGTTQSRQVVLRYFVDESDNLRCASSMAGTSFQSQQGELMMEGIENMQILFGVDTTGTGRISQYIPATDLNVAAATRSTVLAVKVCLKVNSVQPVGNEFKDVTAVTTKKTVQLCDQIENMSRYDPSDNKLHDVFSVSYELPNVLGVNRSY